MTRQEFAIIAKALRSAYKRDKFLTNTDEQEVWYTLLADIPYKVISMAVQQWITTQKWQPSIAEIREIAAEIMNEPIQGVEDAWEKVLKIARAYSPYDTERTEEQIAGLDDISRQCIKLTDICAIAYSENIGVERAHFIKAYERLAREKKKENQTAESLRKAIESVRPEAKPEIPVYQPGIPVFQPEIKPETQFSQELKERFSRG